MSTRKPAVQLKGQETVNWQLALLLFAVALAGCQSGKLTHYISPRVTGRVLAADTRQPLPDATVRRVVPMMAAGEDTQPKGGQLLMRPAGVRTDADGRFVLEGERDIAVFRHPAWWSVTLSFTADGYRVFQTNYTSANVSGHSPEGEPLLNTGDILLKLKSQ
ncbi:MAG: hypothetical protein ACLP2Y_18235 [Limisphaerales bacterium]